MSKSKVLRIIEVVLQIITIVSSILAIKEMIKTYQYKRKLKEKAKTYLDEELGEFQDIKRKVAVFSPEVKEQECQIKKMLSITVIGIISLFAIDILKRD